MNYPCTQALGCVCALRDELLRLYASHASISLLYFIHHSAYSMHTLGLSLSTHCCEFIHLDAPEMSLNPVNIYRVAHKKKRPKLR